MSSLRVNNRITIVRVSGIQADDAETAESCVRAAIASHSTNGLEYISEINIVRSCTDPDRFMALVGFTMLPDFLSSLQGPEKTYTVPLAGDNDLTFDTSFLGLTQTYPTAVTPNSDVVFISGIGGHPYGSWTSKSEPRRMWPRHFLRSRLPNTRVMIYGYEASLVGTSTGQLIDYARGFESSLKQARREDPNRPLVFVAHSFGGNVLKTLLVKEKQMNGSILKATCGILFFGVPHRGMDVDDMMAAVIHRNTSEARLLQISEERHWRQDLDAFRDIIGDVCHVASFYEIQLTRRLAQQPDGSFARTGSFVLATEMESANLGLSSSHESKHPVNADHSMMVKFNNDNVVAFTQALGHLKDMLAFARQKKAEHDKTTLKYLEQLQASDPEHDMNRIEQSKGALIRDCSAWIVQDARFREWQKEDTFPILWLNGDPGKGKTMLMITLARELSTNAGTRAVTYFFCQNTDSLLNNSAAVLRGLIYRLVKSQPLTSYSFQASYEAEKSQLNGSNSIQSLFKILADLLGQCQSTILLIDALDECDPGPQRDQLVHLITEHAQSSKSNWIISSRDHPDIRQSLGLASGVMSLEFKEEDIAVAVRVFINHKTTELAKKRNYSQKLTDEVKKVFIARAESTFLWVSLACESLSRAAVTRNQTLATLRELPKGLQPLYDRMMDQINDIDIAGTREQCVQILRSASLAFRPLLLEELIVVAGFPPGLLEDNELKELISLCGSFVIVRKERLFFIHQSAKDYLVTKGAQKVFPSGSQQEHCLVLSRSLDEMSETLERDMCKLRYPGAARPEVIDDRLRRMKYICCFWIDHLSCLHNNTKEGALSPNQIATGGEIHKFLLRYLLHWFEALSLFSEVSKGIKALQTLMKIVAAMEPVDLATHSFASFLRDADRIIRHFRPAIEEAPLQVYNSLLIFSPENSLVRQNFKQDTPVWISTLPKLPTDWDTCLQTLESKTKVRDMKFLPDGRQLVTADLSVKIWDTTIGECIYELECEGGRPRNIAITPDGRRLAYFHASRTFKIWDELAGASQDWLECLIDRDTPVDISPDGRWLAAGSSWFERNIRVWDMETMDLIWTRQGGNWEVKFSANSRWIMSRSWANTLQIWDTATGAMTGEVKRDNISNITWSPSNRQIAFSDDKTVNLWDILTGDCIHMLGHTAEVSKVIFSPNSQHLASCASDGLVKIWDPAERICIYTLRGHKDKVEALVFSPDSRWLVSGSKDNTLNVWDIVTGGCVQALHGHTESIISLSFSPDGQRLASSSYDCTVRIWDITKRVDLQSFEHHMDAVLLVKVSPDGQQLASFSSDPILRIWDTVTGTCVQRLRSHTDAITFAEFSPDSTFLLSTFADSTVQIWTKTAGAWVSAKIFKLNEDLGSIMFSPDSQRLACFTRHQSIYLWNTVTWASIPTSPGHGYMVSIVFSPDSQRLATVCDLGYLKVLDTSMGSCGTTLKISRNCDKLAFSPINNLLACLISCSRVEIWDMKASRRIQLLKVPESSIDMLAFLPDGEHLACLTDDNKLWIWCRKKGFHQVPGTPERQPKSKFDRWRFSYSGTLRSSELAEHSGIGCGISKDRKWITWNGENILWIPPDLRPGDNGICFDGYDVRSHSVGVGSGTGIVWMITLVSDEYEYTSDLLENGSQESLIICSIFGNTCPIIGNTCHCCQEYLSLLSGIY